MEDIHQYKRRLEKTLESIKDSKEISILNKKVLINFYESLVVEGMSISKTQRYLYDASRVAKLLKKSIGRATESDLRSIVVDIEGRDWTINTKTTFKMGIKKLYKFIDNITEKGVSPRRIKWMKTTIKKSKIKLPGELLTTKEIELMIQKTQSKRDRAFISTLYESGCRVGELGMLKIKEVVFDEHGAKIQVFGKTGSRRVRLVFSSPYLRDWLNDHPNGDNGDSFVWVRSDGILMSHTRMNSLLKEAAKKANIKKRIYPHLFRHSRATFLAGHLTEAQMKICLGWTQNSDMASIYVHLNGRDADNAILKMNGINLEEISKENGIMLKTCLRCKIPNESTNQFCKACGFVLDEEVAVEIIKADSDKQRVDEVMNEIIKDPKILKLILGKIKKKS